MNGLVSSLADTVENVKEETHREMPKHSSTHCLTRKMFYSVADEVAQAKAHTLSDTLGDVEDYALVDLLPDTLAKAQA